MKLKIYNLAWILIAYLFTAVLYPTGRKLLGQAQVHTGIRWVSQKLILIYPANCGVPADVGSFCTTQTGCEAVKCRR